jgi:hypothetical protein
MGLVPPSGLGDWVTFPGKFYQIPVKVYFSPYTPFRMKFTHITPVLLAASLVFSSCGGKKESQSDTETIDASNPISALQDLEKAGEKMQENQNEAEKVAAERRKKGDTLVMHYKELQKFLPQSVEGYEKDGDPTGETVNGAGMSVSTATQKFRKGSDFLSVTMTDYNQAYAMMQGLISAGGMFSVDSDDEKINKYDIGVGKTTAIENYKKKDKDATVTVATGYRFWIEAKANNQPDTEKLKTVVKNLKIKELSEM